MKEAPLAEGARCGRHPEAPAIAICARCGDFVCAPCASRGAGDRRYCPRCEDFGRERFPWERRGELGLLRAFGATFFGSLLSPTRTFSLALRDRSFVPALAYGLFLNVLSASGALAYDLIEGHVYSGAWIVPQYTFVRALASPILFVLALGLLASLWWLALAIVGARSSSSFPQLARAMSYVTGSVAPFGVIAMRITPRGTVLLLAAWFLYQSVLQTLAVRSLARIEPWRAALAWVLVFLGLVGIFLSIGLTVTFLRRLPF
jgi:hypothetical protein